MRLPTILPGLAGKIVKYRPLSEPIISGFGGFRPLASLEKNKKVYCTLKVHGTQCKQREHSSFQYLSFTKEKGQNLVQNSDSGVMLGTFSVDMLQVKVKFRLKFFNLGWFSKYYLCLLTLILMIIMPILRIINLNLILTYTDTCKPLNKCNLTKLVNIRQKCIQNCQLPKTK